MTRRTRHGEMGLLSSAHPLLGAIGSLGGSACSPLGAKHGHEGTAVNKAARACLPALPGTTGRQATPVRRPGKRGRRDSGV